MHGVYTFDIRSGISKHKRGFLFMHSRRREFLITSGALLAMPFIPRTSYAADVDVIIIGAGAAGLAAARQFMDAGISFKLIEARRRIGGRAYTDTHTFGVPFDRGCWLQHSAHQNPWVPFATRHGFDIVPMPTDGKRFWIGSREATRTEYEAIYSAQMEIRAAIAKAGMLNQDISAQQAIEGIATNEWVSRVKRWFWSGRDFEKVSTADWWNSGGGPNYHCRAGYGTLVSKFGQAIPVTFENPVTSIDWSGTGVRVETSNGSLKARYCIVTVSSGVLASESIHFKPVLPQWKQDAIEAVPMANATIIGLQFQQPQILPAEQNNWFSYWTDDGRGLSFASNVGSWGIQRGATRGHLATELAAAGPQATIDYALEGLKSALGSKIEQSFIKGWVSNWVVDPFARGTWSSALPGKAHRRDDLRRPLGDTVLFAGEACHEFMYSTCHGAYLSGTEVALQVASKLSL